MPPGGEGRPLMASVLRLKSKPDRGGFGDEERIKGGGDVLETRPQPLGRRSQLAAVARGVTLAARSAHCRLGLVSEQRLPPRDPLQHRYGETSQLARLDGDGELQRVKGALAFSNEFENANASFTRSSSPSPSNLASETFRIPVLERVAQGEALFRHETFGGNGRTCGECHPARDSGRLTPSDVQARFKNVSTTFDPLFVAETAATGFDFNLNTLAISGRPSPPGGTDFLSVSGGDLRGRRDGLERRPRQDPRSHEPDGLSGLRRHGPG